MPEFARSLAIIIGIDQYQNGINPLASAVNDAKAIAKSLADHHQYQIFPELILNETATLTRLKTLLKELPQIVGENDRLLFYFAGHGIAKNSQDGEPEGYLLPQDAERKNPESWLRMTDLHDALIAVPCRHFLGILDCCFAGAFSWSSMRDVELEADRELVKERFDRYIQSPAWQVITSAGSDQKAWDVLRDERGIASGQNSPFANALLQALEGKVQLAQNGVITTAKLYVHLEDFVGNSTEASQQQTPGLFPLKKHKNGQYIFLTSDYVYGELPKADPLDESKNPYQGLESFEEKQSDLFFGRQALTEKLRNVVSSQSLTVVLGTSGSGKSSLVKAGLIHALKQENEELDQQKWCFSAPMRPGESPFQALSNALAQVSSFSPSSQTSEPPEARDPNWFKRILKQLKQGSGRSPQKQKLGEEAQAIDRNLATWSQQNPNSKLLLVIDQSEELFTLCRDEQERQKFLHWLIQTIAAYPDQLRVVLTLRLDYEPQFQATELAASWSAARFVVSPMTRAELREAIEEPAFKRVMHFESEDPKDPLVDQLINEVAETPGALPLLSFTLSELYIKYLKRQHDAELGGKTVDRVITEKDYKELGGVARSLTQRADQEYEQLVKRELAYQNLRSGFLTNENAFLIFLWLFHESLAYEKTIRNVMLRMVTISTGGLARRQVKRSELEYPQPENRRVSEVIDNFTAARLLVQGCDAEDNLCVEPAHDALVRGWQKILDWKEKEQENLLLQRRLTPDAEAWKSRQPQEQPEKFIWYWNPAPWNPLLWHSDPRINLLKQVRASNHNWLNQIEDEFVQRSILQKSINGNGVIVIFGVVFVVVVGFALNALQGQAGALRGQISASRQTAEAELKSHHELKALLAALQAGKLLENPPWWYSYTKSSADPTLTAQVKGTLYKVLYSVKEQNELEVNHEAIYDVALNPNGKYLAIVGESDTIVLQDDQGTQLGQFSTGQKKLYSVAWGPNGRLATGAEDGTVKLWKIEENGTFKSENNKNPIPFPSTSENENEKDKTSASGKEGTKDKTINQITFNAKGDTAATVDANGTVKLWSTTLDSDPSKNKVIPVSDSKLEALRKKLAKDNSPYRFYSVAFSPSGKTLAIVGEADTVILWDILDKKEIGQFSTGQKKDQADVQSVAFKTEEELATGLEDGTIKLWKIAENSQPLQPPHLAEPNDPAKPFNTGQGSVSKLVFNLDGHRMATFGENETVKLWDNPIWNGQDNVNPILIQAPQGNVVTNSVAFSPDSKELATAGADGIVRRWDLQGKQIFRIETKQDSVSSLGYFKDKKNDENRLLTLGEKGKKATAKIWDITSADPEPIKTIDLGELKKEAEKTYDMAYKEGKSLFFLFKNKIVLSPDQQQLAFVGSDGKVRLWHLSGNLPQQVQVEGVTSMAFSPNGSLAVLGKDGTVNLWDTKNNQFDNPVQIKTQQQDIVSLVFNSDDELKTVGKDAVKPWNVKNNKVDGPAKTFRMPSMVANSGAFSPDGKQLATIEDSTVKLWLWDDSGNPFPNQQAPNLERLKEFGAVKNVAFNPHDANLLAIVSQKDQAQVILWDISKGDIRQLISMEQKAAQIAFSPDGQQLATADSEGIVKRWDINGKLLGQIRTEQTKDKTIDKTISTMVFNADGKQLTTLGKDGTLKLWDISGAQPDEPLQIQDKISSVIFSPDGKQLVTADQDSNVKLWQVELRTMMQQGCSWAKDHLDNKPSLSDSDRKLCGQDNKALASKPAASDQPDRCLNQQKSFLQLKKEDLEKPFTYPNTNNSVLYFATSGDKGQPPANSKDSKGTMVFLDKGLPSEIYSGEFVKGKRQGCGTHLFSDGKSYIGSFENDKPNGQGIWLLGNAVYIGESKASRCEGKGTYINKDGLFFRSDNWKDGRVSNGNITLSCDF